MLSGAAEGKSWQSLAGGNPSRGQQLPLDLTCYATFDFGSLRMGIIKPRFFFFGVFITKDNLEGKRTDQHSPVEIVHCQIPSDQDVRSDYSQDLMSEDPITRGRDDCN